MLKHLLASRRRGLGLPNSFPISNMVRFSYFAWFEAFSTNKICLYKFKSKQRMSRKPQASFFHHHHHHPMMMTCHAPTPHVYRDCSLTHAHSPPISIHFATLLHRTCPASTIGHIASHYRLTTTDVSCIATISRSSSYLLAPHKIPSKQQCPASRAKSSSSSSPSP